MSKQRAKAAETRPPLELEPDRAVLTSHAFGVCVELVAEWARASIQGDADEKILPYKQRLLELLGDRNALAWGPAALGLALQDVSDVFDAGMYVAALDVIFSDLAMERSR